MWISRLQALVGLTAGLISIVGALFSMPQFFKLSPGMGKLVTTVQDTESNNAVPDAIVEILTPQNTLVTTLKPNVFGHVRHTLPEGLYRVRVTHPRFHPEIRQVHVLSGQTAEVRVRLSAASSSPLGEVFRAVQRAFGR